MPAQLATVALAASALVAMGRMHELDRWIQALDALADDAMQALEDRGHPGQGTDGDMTVGFRDAPVPA